MAIRYNIRPSSSSCTHTVVTEAEQITDDSFSRVDADCSDNHLADTFHHSSAYITTSLVISLQQMN